MDLQLIQLPRDLTQIGEMIGDAFQYPENPEWSVQEDEKEHLANAVKSLRRLWPLFRLMQAVSPPLRDLFRGYVAVDGGRIVGLTLVQRRGTTNIWIVGTVGVLPDYRRRGLAREGLEKSLDLMRQHGAVKTWLGVINGNAPAQGLYTSLGFEVYDSSFDYTLKKPSIPTVPPLPAEYELAKLKLSDWRTRFELEDRIAPEETRHFEPVEKGRFKTPLMLRLLSPILNLIQRTKEADWIVREVATDRVVGRCGYVASKRGKGVNGLLVRLDPETAHLAPHVVGLMLQRVVSLSPNLRVELGVPRWMPAVAEAAESYGFERRVEYLKMGRDL
jgi:ribosomal protein S18 acetylase RimI-like enzyme